MKQWRAGANVPYSWRLRMEPWRICRPAVADSHHFDEEQDPDPQNLIRIRIIRIRNTALYCPFTVYIFCRALLMFFFAPVRLFDGRSQTLKRLDSQLTKNPHPCFPKSRLYLAEHYRLNEAGYRISEVEELRNIRDDLIR